MEKPVLVRSKAFTIIELMVAVTVISLLASISTIHLLRGQHFARYSTLKKWVRSVSDATEIYQSSLGSYPSDITSLTSPVPPYLNSDVAARCGTAEGNWTLFCVFNSSGTAVYNYQFYVQESVDSPSLFGIYRHGGGSATPGRFEVTDLFEGGLL